jgi:hypothetical protein
MTRIIRAPNEQPIDSETLASRPKPGAALPRTIREKPLSENSTPKASKANKRERIQKKKKPKPLQVKTLNPPVPKQAPITKARMKDFTRRSSPSKGKQAWAPPSKPAIRQASDQPSRPKPEGTDWEAFKKLAVAQESEKRASDDPIRRAQAFAKWALNHPFQAGRG